MPVPAPRQPLVLSALAGTALIATAAWLAHDRPTPRAEPPLLVAPMIGGLDGCLQGQAPPLLAEAGCTGPGGSAAGLVEATLRPLQPAPGSGKVLGYTLKAPLLDFLRRQAGQWVVDPEAVARLTRTLAETPRPVVLYLFATHFETGAAIETELAADAANLAAGPQGPLPVDRYFGARLYPWSVARTDNPLTQRRTEVIQAIAEAACRLNPAVRERIAGITLLGEVHQLFPDFEAGMGFDRPYTVSDYSPTSRQAFRVFLKQRLGSVEAVNRLAGTAWRSWAEVQAPEQGLSPQRPAPGWRHLDPYAHGVLPVSGWVGPDRQNRWGQGSVRIYVDGQFVARTPIGLGRQDLAQALPELGSADLAWRYDLDYRGWTPGAHQIDLYLERSGQALRHLATRHIEVAGTRGRAQPAHGAPPRLPAAPPPADGLRHHTDTPPESSRYLYNPLATLWQQFRNEQVANYIDHFRTLLAGTCLRDRPLYTHQLMPYGNPSWDSTRFAVDRSLQPMTGLNLGVSLYGEPTYGASFPQWLRTRPAQPYGITEFHPLRALDARSLDQALEQHRRRGARFVSMFLEGRWQGQFSSDQHNQFSFDPANREFGSDRLYQSLQQVLQPSGTAPGGPQLP